jgi:hypothetical protein
MDSVFQFCAVKEKRLKESGYEYIQIKLNAVNGHQDLYNAVRGCSFTKRAAKRYCFILICAVGKTRKNSNGITVYKKICAVNGYQI